MISFGARKKKGVLWKRTRTIHRERDVKRREGRKGSYVLDVLEILSTVLVVLVVGEDFELEPRTEVFHAGRRRIEIKGQ